jgi:uncharacterized integral membrane protein (TIGR00698 family)
MKRPSTPDIFDSWDSMEGLTSVAPPAPNFRVRAQRALTWVGDRTAGFFLAATLAFLADWVADVIGKTVFGYGTNPISGIPLAIAMGILLCNTVGIPAIFIEGLRACMRPLQRLAIMLLGWRLSLGAVGGIGIQALPVVFVTITAALIIIPWIGEKAGLSRRLSTLIAVGTSICGVSAIMATAPAIDADEGEVSYAVACVAIFGMLAMLIYPFIVPWFLGNNLTAIGIFFGVAIHDTAQVTGAALAFQQGHNAPEVLNIATVVKIMRNLSMAAVIPLMAALFHRGKHGGAAKSRPKHQILPPFVLGFLGLTVARTIGDASTRAFGIIDHNLWAHFLVVMDHASTWFLTIVMAAVGLSTGLSNLKRLGWRPFFVGLSAAVIVGAIGLSMIKVLAALHN